MVNERQLEIAVLKLASEKPELGDILLKTLADHYACQGQADACQAQAEDEEEKDAKFERGENVPLSELPEELQENVKNPPPSVEKLKNKLKSSADKDAGCEKLPEGPMRDNCEKKSESKDDDKDEEKKDDKKQAKVASTKDLDLFPKSPFPPTASQVAPVYGGFSWD